MNAIILSVGDELVLGQTVDTNAVWLSQQLAAVGCDIVGHRTIGDDRDQIAIAIAESAEIADVLVLSGGLGPTEDDLTRQAIADLNEVELALDERWYAHMQGFFRQIGRVMPESNRIQAMIPRGAEMIWNTCGTAAGIRAQIRTLDLNDPEVETADDDLAARDVPLFAMPGVPKEMKAMFLRDVLPWIKEQTGGAVILSRTLHTFGLGESSVAEKIAGLMTRGRNPSVGTTVAGGIVSLRVNARFPSREVAAEELEETCRQCAAGLGDLIYGQDDEPLASVVARMLKESPQKPTVATAESCTGGLLAKMLTDVAGSSSYFRQGWVTYANEAKSQLLGVPADVIAANGAVSEPVVRAMTLGAQERSGATYALGVSGIAGPDGGSPEKPVGTVWFGLAHPDGVDARRFVLSGDREMIRDRAAKMALTMLRFRLLGKPLPF